MHRVGLWWQGGGVGRASLHRHGVGGPTHVRVRLAPHGRVGLAPHGRVRLGVDGGHADMLRVLVHPWEHHQLAQSPPITYVELFLGRGLKGVGGLMVLLGRDGDT